MDDSLAQLAQDIAVLKKLLVGAIIVMGAVLAALLAMLVMAVRTNKLAYDRSIANMFKDEGEHLLNQKSYDQLIKKCNERIKASPGDAWAYYYLANAYYRRGDLVRAKEYFVTSSQMEPLFRSHAEEVLKEIDVALQNTRPRSV